MKKNFLIGLLLGCFLYIPSKAIRISNDPEIKSQVRTELLSEEFRVFPNPVFQKQFTVELSTAKITEIKIANIAGRQVFDRTYHSPGNRVTVQTNDIPDGIYFLKVKATNHISKTVKLIIRSKN